MRNSWFKIYCISKKVVKRVDSLCRAFIWCGKELGYKKASVSWDHICLPKVCGSLNLYNMAIWNQAALMKHFWAIASKKDCL